MQVAETAGSQSKIKKFIEGHASYLLLTITNWQRVKICENSLHILKTNKWSYERYHPYLWVQAQKKSGEVCLSQGHQNIPATSPSNKWQNTLLLCLLPCNFLFKIYLTTLNLHFLPSQPLMSRNAGNYMYAQFW